MIKEGGKDAVSVNSIFTKITQIVQFLCFKTFRRVAARKNFRVFRMFFAKRLKGNVAFIGYGIEIGESISFKKHPVLYLYGAESDSVWQGVQRGQMSEKYFK